MTHEPCDTIKCNFCEWSCAKWRTNKKGKPVHNYFRLKDHCVEKHSDLDVVKLFLLNDAPAVVCWCGDIHDKDGHPIIFGGVK
jgi:hypothetical protein